MYSLKFCLEIHNIFTKLLETPHFYYFSLFCTSNNWKWDTFPPTRGRLPAFNKWECAGFCPMSVVKKLPPLPPHLVRRVFTVVNFTIRWKKKFSKDSSIPWNLVLFCIRWNIVLIFSVFSIYIALPSYIAVDYIYRLIITCTILYSTSTGFS
jgi:hypothetical protein